MHRLPNCETFANSLVSMTIGNASSDEEIKAEDFEKYLIGIRSCGKFHSDFS